MSLESNLAEQQVVTGKRTRAFAVLNPRSGSVTVLDVRKAINDHLSGADVEIHEVAEGDDLPSIIRDALARGCDPIVAAGGDGTVSTVADVLVGTEAHLVVLPLGTANVLARELGIPVDIGAACKLGGHCMSPGSLAGKLHDVVKLDAMKIKGRHYLTQVGVGIDALMIRDTTTAHKRRFGRLAYLWTGLKSLAGYQPRRFTITIDDRTIVVKASQVLVANTGMMGQPPFRWGPDIRSDDGKLNLCIVRARNLGDYTKLALRVVTGRHRSKSLNVRYEVAERSIIIDTKHHLPVQADGEIIGDTPIRVEVIPGALRVVVPIDRPVLD